MSEETTREKVTKRLLDWVTHEMEGNAKQGKDAYEGLLTTRMVAKENAVTHALPGYVVDNDDWAYDRMVTQRVADGEKMIDWHTEMGAALAELAALLMTRDRTEIPR